MKKNKMNRRILIIATFCIASSLAQAQQKQTKKVGDFIESISYNEHQLGAERHLQYYPDGEDFVCVNGDNRYTRALYGGHSEFRLETSDYPVFASYIKRNCKHIQFELQTSTVNLALDSVEHCEARYCAGRRNYLLRDSRLSGGELQISVLALHDKDGAIWKFQNKNFQKHVKIKGIISEIRNSKLNRSGDMGVDPEDSFEFPLNPQQLQTCEEEIKDVLYVLLENQKLSFVSKKQGEAIYQEAENARQKIANQLQIKTPDPYFNTLGGTVATAANGIWSGEVWLHGAIGWRMPLSGWRAAYTGDVLGWHDRARAHFDAYANSQVTDVPNTIPHPAQDKELNLARSDKSWGTPQYSNGYICRNPNRNNQMHHYDMNLCYIDELLWHFNWTGDIDYVKKMWPVIVRHLAWEKLNYDPNNDGLYDAYASIWASDALYYNSGAVTHSSAYNYRANKMAAKLAVLIDEDATPYQQEAAKIHQAINECLWIPSKGHWAEFEDFMGHKRLHENAGVWTIYHAIDGEIADDFQKYQASRYLDESIPHISVVANGLVDEDYATIATTNWLPYSWSINNVAFSEVAHTALSYWQAGRNKNAFKLFKSSILDGMYLGDSPGNIGQLSFYDSARGECYRDFGDPIGTYSRALVQGLFGINPSALDGKLKIQPGFPSNWEFASIETPDIYFDFKQKSCASYYKIRSNMEQISNISLHVKASKDKIKSLTLNGKKQAWKNAENVGEAQITIDFPCSKGNVYELKIEWSGESLKMPNYTLEVVKGGTWELSSKVEILELKDPQQILKENKFNSHKLETIIDGELGHRTLFVKLKQSEIIWWQPIDVEIKKPFELINHAEENNLQLELISNLNSSVECEVRVNAKARNYTQNLKLNAKSSAIIKVPSQYSKLGSNIIEVFVNNKLHYQGVLKNWNLKNNTPNYEMVNLDAQMNASVSDIFNNEYLSPRSPYTTLQIPTQGIGEWCHPLLSAEINDAGIRKAAVDNCLQTPMGIPFRTTNNGKANNVVYTSLWNNYPNKIAMPLSGKASHAYLLMVGSTNHMQCHMVNGTIKVKYTDGSISVLELIPPETWYPIEQDYFINNKAFSIKEPRPYRVALKTAIISRNMERDMCVKPTEVYGRTIDGGAGVILDLPLDEQKELKSIELETISNDVVIGLMGVTLLK